MAKQALGRNLGELLEGGPAAPPSAQPGVGVRSLMHGRPKAELPAPHPATLPRWYLFGGDIVLTALAVVIAAKSRHPLSAGRVLFCVICAVLGTGLALAAICQREEQ